jgi:hypothetical protein
MHLKNVPHVLLTELDRLRQHLREDIKAEALARQAGFLRRTPRKIPMADFLVALLALAAESFLTLERAASIIALAAELSYSKQALHKRLTPAIEGFVAQAATALFGQLPEARARFRGLLQPFGRVLLHDSTVETLPEHLAKVFPGSRNQRKSYAALKIQFITDLLSGQPLRLSLSSFRRNDQSAAQDVLEVARAGDLILRDLGYFALPAFQRIMEVGAFFVSRCRADMTFYDPATDKPLNLVRELRRCPRLVREVLLGAQRLRVRLVALPLPEELVNRHRGEARKHGGKSSVPTSKRLFLMGWALLITNVPDSLWSARVLAAVYRLRWRIEMIFKAWKSHLGFRHFYCRSAKVLRLAVMTKLLFCVLVYRCCQSLELLCGRDQRHISLQRLARIMAGCTAVVEARLRAIAPEELWEYSIGHHVFYEHRDDRENFCEIFATLATE